MFKKKQLKTEKNDSTQIIYSQPPSSRSTPSDHSSSLPWAVWVLPIVLPGIPKRGGALNSGAVCLWVFALSPFSKQSEDPMPGLELIWNALNPGEERSSVICVGAPLRVPICCQRYTHACSSSSSKRLTVFVSSSQNIFRAPEGKTGGRERSRCLKKSS